MLFSCMSVICPSSDYISMVFWYKLSSMITFTSFHLDYVSFLVGLCVCVCLRKKHNKVGGTAINLKLHVWMIKENRYGTPMGPKRVGPKL